MKNLTAEKVIAVLEKEVFTVSSTEVLFNPYKDVDSQLDKPNAAEIRRENLKAYVQNCFSNNSETTFLIIGEAPGPRGCRFSGIPFTNEAQLLEGHLYFTGQQSSKREEPYCAPASKIFWRVMFPYLVQGKSFFMWNCVPFHPHKKDKPLSVRNPTAKEILDCSMGLLELIEAIHSSHIIAIGRKAEQAISLIKVKSTIHPVRHPSRGGATLFEKQIKAVLEN